VASVLVSSTRKSCFTGVPSPARTTYKGGVWPEATGAEVWVRLQGRPRPAAATRRDAGVLRQLTPVQPRPSASVRPGLQIRVRGNIVFSRGINREQEILEIRMERKREKSLVLKEFACSGL
jgi:hypothetical protein